MHSTDNYKNETKKMKGKEKYEQDVVIQRCWRIRSIKYEGKAAIKRTK